MKVGLAWLGEFVEIGDLSPEEVADRLTMLGLEVEGLDDDLGFLTEVVVGRVAAAKPHGRSLMACLVDYGQGEPLTVLTGAPNVREGGLYPLAPAGVSLPAGSVKAATLAGLVSQGVLCSAWEIGLPGGAEGLMELSAEARPGEPLKKLYPDPDWVLDISVTPNRADALSVRGVARDLAAALNRPLKDVRVDLTEKGRPAAELAKVDIECPDHCWRYCGRIVRGIKIGRSPSWLAKRLWAAGLRPINNAVDVTNYVMLELGLPLHAFDLAQLAQSRIVVRLAGAGVEFTTLDGQARTLKAPQNVMICDGQRPVALGGVMGGLNSEVEPHTQDVFLEGAAFNPTTIRRTARAQGLATDASYRFERGQDPGLPPLAVDRAAALLAEIAGGEIAPGRLDAYPRPRPPIKVPFSPKRCAAVLGVERPLESLTRALTAIGVSLVEVAPDRDGVLFEATLPTFRPDLTREIDLTEEAVRLLDFQNLPATLPKPPAIAQKAPTPYRLRASLRRDLSGLGLSEIISYSFVNPAFLDQLALPADHPFRRGAVKVLNPLSEDHGILRPSLAPGLLAALRLNQFHGRWSAALFEVGAVFLANEGSERPLERQSLGFLLAGRLGQGNFNDPARPVDFWDLKGLAEELGERRDRALAFAPLEKTFGHEGFPFYEPGQAAAVLVDGQAIGHLGQLGAQAQKALGLKAAGGQVFFGELDLTDWPAAGQRAFKGWSSFPGVYRDLAIVVADEVPAQAVLDNLQDESWPLTKTAIFDVYRGENIPKGQKSLAIRLFFQSPDRTLTDELVNGYFDAIAARLAERLSAVLRS
ncbi:MAG: phenylalanine--tRNA ligase subunit beta [Deltaproteobacteria bacterium]|jgi:phenylalanyl-tRNA synthetase beta chain|nr:phenylalanine--tRNA ligase subunit beta [Deltaproteobacteria bacterium]